MDRAELRAAQQPLKDRHREEPGAALVTLTASGSLGEGITCSVLERNCCLGSPIDESMLLNTPIEGL